MRSVPAPIAFARPTAMLMAALLIGCQTVPIARQEETTLFFGMGGSGKSVTPVQWDAFVANEVATRFPEGFTVLDAHGHWQDHGTAYDEPARVIIIVHPHLTTDDQKLNELRKLYCERFGQTSVMRVDQSVRHVSF